jgi:phosphatidylethanolamine/phosphatidyl-N-methylethanolamine N-methyltransferase
MITTESVQEAYRRYAHYYDLVFGAVFNQGRKIAIDRLNCQATDRILEVGVGTGLSLCMYPKDVQVVGVDLSHDMLERAKKKVETDGLNHVEELLQMDAQDMQFPDNSFDKVVAMYVASVVPDVSLLAQEIRRVCKPGGTIIYLNHFEHPNPLIRRAEAFVQPLAEYLGFHPEFPMNEFLEKTGFEIKEKIPVNFLDYWTVLVGENKKPKTKRSRT